MSVHIGGQPGDIAERVLLPGDPMRAKWIAETFLQDAKCYTQVRGMLGFTGTYQGVPVSVQGSGMGMPSASIYTHELINEYGVKSLIRIGSCGALAPDLQLGTGLELIVQTLQAVPQVVLILALPWRRQDSLDVGHVKAREDLRQDPRLDRLVIGSDAAAAALGGVADE